MTHSVDNSGTVKSILMEDLLEISEDLIIVVPVRNAPLKFFEHLDNHDVRTAVFRSLERTQGSYNGSIHQVKLLSANNIPCARDYARTGRRSGGQTVMISDFLDQTHTPCIGRQSLNHWTAREVPNSQIIYSSPYIYM